MSFINFSARELNIKLVYYGPPWGGKSTNLQRIFNTADPAVSGQLNSLPTDAGQTLFFDFLPQFEEEVHGLRTRIHIYAVCGEVSNEAHRKLVLQGVDGVCFVADSQPQRMPANFESLQSCGINLSALGSAPNQVPFVFQYNKRDLQDAVPTGELSRSLNPGGKPEFEAIATAGLGVLETFNALAMVVLKR